MNRLRRMGMSSSGGAAGFLIDFSAQAASYPGVIFTTTGTVYPVIGGVPTLTTGATTPIWEDRGGVNKGVYVFPPTTNGAPNHRDFTVPEWIKFRAATATATAILGPDGLTTASSLNDPGGQSGEIYAVFPGGAIARFASVWLMDGTPTPNYQAQLLSNDFTGTNAPWQTDGVRIPVSAWREVTAYDVTGTWCGIAPCTGGVAHGNNGAGVGSTLAWGMNTTAGPWRAPLIASGTAEARVELDAPTSAKLINDQGDFDVKITFTCALGDMSSRGIAPTANVNIGDQQYLPTAYLLSAMTDDGALTIRHRAATGGAASYYTLTVRGTDVLSSPNGGWTGILGGGQITTVRPYYNRTDGISGIRLSVNGCFVPDATGVATGAALAAPSSVSIGTNLGSSTAALTTKICKIERPDSPIQAVEPVEILVCGDSTAATFGTTYVAVGSYIYTPAEIGVRPGIGSIAASGHAIIAQQNAFSASAWSTAPSVAAVVIQMGYNDVAAGVPAATVIAGYQTFVNVVRAAMPLAKIIVCQMTPAHLKLAALNAGYPAVWLAVNDAIAGRGGSPITGADGRVLTGDIGSPLNNGSYEIPAAYAVSAADGVHQNNPGRAVNAAMWRVELVAQSVLPA